MMQSESVTSFTKSIQSYHKSRYPNTKIDIDMLNEAHHKKTVEKVATRRINERGTDHMHEKHRNHGDDNESSQSLQRNYATLRAAVQKPSATYMGHKTHPKLLKLKQQGAELVQRVHQLKYLKDKSVLDWHLSKQNEKN
eukprot:307947_1